MKIGDQFKQGNYSNIYTLVRLGYTNEVRVFSVTDNAILVTFKGQVEDLENITEEEFRNILVASQEYMYQYTHLDGTTLFPEETYRYGDVFEIISYPHRDESVGQKLMLCQVGYSKYCLVTVDGFSRGNRWSDPIEPKNNMAITKEELRQMCGSAQSVVLKKVNE